MGRREKKGGCLVCLATGADPVIRERLGIVVAAAPRPLYGAMDGAHKGWMAPTMNRGYPRGKSPTKEDTHEREYPWKRIPTKEDTHERGYQLSTTHKREYPRKRIPTNRAD